MAKTTKEQVRKAVAQTIRDTIESYENDVRALRTRELKLHKREGLAKSDLCPICGNEDVPGSCTCIGMHKDEMADPGDSGGLAMGEGKSAAGIRGTPAYNINNSIANLKTPKAAAPPVAMKPALGKGELCEKCGKEGDLCKCMAKDEIPSAPAAPRAPKTPIRMGSAERGKNRPAMPVSPTVPKGGGIANIIKSEELAKDATKIAFGLPSERKAPPLKAVLPGMTGVAAAPTTLRTNTMIGGMGGAAARPPHPSIASSIGEAKTMLANKPVAGGNPTMGHLTPSVPPQARGAAIDAAFGAIPANVRKIGADETLAARAAQSKAAGLAVHPGNEAAELKADMKAGGVGWLNKLVSSFKGTGNKTWEAMRGAGASAHKAGSRVGAAMGALARSEQEIDLIKSLGNCVLCNKDEHAGICQ